MVRRLVLVVLVLSLCSTVASATSFGSFTGVVFGALETSRSPCAATDVVLLDDGIEVLPTTLTVASEITAVRLEGVTGDCGDHEAVVVVMGDDLLDLTSDTVVLHVIGGLDPGLSGGQLLSEPRSLSSLLYSVSGDGVAFCPAGATCT